MKFLILVLMIQVGQKKKIFENCLELGEHSSEKYFWPSFYFDCKIRPAIAKILKGKKHLDAEAVDLIKEFIRICNVVYNNDKVKMKNNLNWWFYSYRCFKEVSFPEDLKNFLAENGIKDDE